MARSIGRLALQSLSCLDFLLWLLADTVLLCFVWRESPLSPFNVFLAGHSPPLPLPYIYRSHFGLISTSNAEAVGHSISTLCMLSMPALAFFPPLQTLLKQPRLLTWQEERSHRRSPEVILMPCRKAFGSDGMPSKQIHFVTTLLLYFFLFGAFVKSIYFGYKLEYSILCTMTVEYQ